MGYSSRLKQAKVSSKGELKTIRVRSEEEEKKKKQDS
jgi:hypothetical protein